MILPLGPVPVTSIDVDVVLGDQTTNDRRQQPVVGRRIRIGRCRLVSGSSRRDSRRRRRLDDGRSSGRFRRQRRARARRQARAPAAGSGSAAGSGAGGGFGLRARGGAAAGRGGSLADDRDHGADGHGVAFLDADLGDGPGDRRGHLGVDLVGAHFEQRLVGGDGVADLLEPTGDRALGDGLTELRQRDFGHGVVSLFDRIRR